jgi:hypothetical protein
MDQNIDRSLSKTMETSVEGLGAVQSTLDAEVERDLLLWAEFVRQLPADSPAGAIAQELHANPLRLAEYQITLDIALSTTEEKGLDVGLNILAQPVHSFYRSRFGTSETEVSKVELHCRAVAAGPPETERNSSASRN